MSAQPITADGSLSPVGSSAPGPAADGASQHQGFAVLHVRNDSDAVLHPAAANAPEHGRIGIRVRPGIRRSHWLSSDLLAACGADFTITGSGRNADENLQLLPVRLVSDGITDVLVDAAESLTVSMLTDLVLVAAAAGTRLWLVTAPPVTDALMGALTDWCALETPLADAAARWPGLTTPTIPADVDDTSAAVVDADEPPRLPLVDATTLLATCHRLLPAQQARWVGRRLRAAVADATAELADTSAAPATGRGPVPTERAEQVAQWLLRHYDNAGTLTQFLCDVRGLQIAGLWHGLHIGVDVPALAGAAAAAPSAAARTPQVWNRLRAYRLPVRGAACALAAARLGADAICALTVGETAADGTTVTSAGGVVPLEPAAAPFVAAQRLLRLASGAPATAPLLATVTGGPMTDKALARLLTEARTELGVLVTSRLVERAAPDGATVLRRWGIVVTSIGDPVPGGPGLTSLDAPPSLGLLPSPAPGPVPAPSPAALLDVELLRRRRIEMRLSHRDVAKRLGVTTAVVSRLETGVNHGEQPLSLLLRLTDLLALDLADLLPHRTPAGAATGPHDTPGPDAASTGTGTTAAGPTTGSDSTDAQTLGAALHTLGVLVPRDTLAEVLGWTAARLEDALTELERTAPSVGQRVHRLYGKVSLVRSASALPAEQLAAALRYDAARTGLDAVQARLVHTALTRTVAPPARRGGSQRLVKSNAEQVAAGALVGAAILTPDGGDLTLHPDAALSLLLPAAAQR